MAELRQFKLVGGDELIAEIVQWPDPDLGEDQIIARNAMKIVCYESPHEGYRYYTFRPWIVFSEKDQLITITNYHIVGESMPTVEVIHQYNKALKNMDEDRPQSDEKKATTQDILDEVRKQISEAAALVFDSDHPNVISFPKGTIH